MPGGERALTVQATRRVVALGMVRQSAAGVGRCRDWHGGYGAADPRPGRGVMTEMLSEQNAAAELPVAATARWQPPRLGLVDIFITTTRVLVPRRAAMLRGDTGPESRKFSRSPFLPPGR